jgi:hypothetical protein
MTLDPEAIRRMIREDREQADKERADKAERDDLRTRLEALEKKPAKPDHEAAPKTDDDDHDFVL